MLQVYVFWRGFRWSGPGEATPATTAIGPSRRRHYYPTRGVAYFCIGAALYSNRRRLYYPAGAVIIYCSEHAPPPVPPYTR